MTSSGGDRSSRAGSRAWFGSFLKAFPVAATDEDLRLIRNLGGESDSASRQVARYIAEVGDCIDTGVKPLLIFRLDRFLRGGDHISFNHQGYRGGALHRISRGLSPSASERSHRKRHRIRRSSQVRRTSIMSRMWRASIRQLWLHWQRRPLRPARFACKPRIWRTIPPSPGEASPAVLPTKCCGARPRARNGNTFFPAGNVNRVTLPYRRIM